MVEEISLFHQSFTFIVIATSSLAKPLKLHS